MRSRQLPSETSGGRLAWPLWGPFVAELLGSCLARVGAGCVEEVWLASAGRQEHSIGEVTRYGRSTSLFEIGDRPLPGLGFDRVLRNRLLAPHARLVDRQWIAGNAIEPSFGPDPTLVTGESVDARKKQEAVVGVLDDRLGGD